MGMLSTPASVPTAAPKPDNAKPNGKITPESIRSQLHLSGNQGAQLDRIVLAGKKVMFDKSTHQLMLQQMDGDGPMPEKLGKGVAGLMGLLWQESKQSLPPQLLIPAGMVLVAVAANFLQQAGEQITDQDIGSGIEVMVSAMLQTSGVDPNKVAEIGASAGQGGEKMPAAQPDKIGRAHV